jgi:pyrimidine-nucleoside phosphorylase
VDALSPTALIGHKRDGLEHSPEEIHELIGQFMSGRLTDYQMTAWLMAAFLRGLSRREMVALTDAMLRSGDVLELRSIDRPKVDKHSTGGVGDKISLCLGPLVAACGAAVPMIAGRGLGHTGGTLDKLEAIPGYDVHLSARRFERVVREAGVAIIGQTPELAPADRRIYALRDVTGTVASIPLIVASILSKKLAEGIDALVLDVKVGRGAFMKDLPSGRALARALVQVGTGSGKSVRALLTDMDAPIGRTIGNALELREAIDVLHDAGPPDTRELTLALGEQMLVAAGLQRNRAAARAALEQALSTGRAYEHFERMVRAQGGDVRFVASPERLPSAPVRVEVLADRSGHLHGIDALALGRVAVALGAGRQRAEDRIDPAVGIELCVGRGARLRKGERLAVLHLARGTSKELHQRWADQVRAAFELGKAGAVLPPLVHERVG